MQVQQVVNAYIESIEKVQATFLLLRNRVHKLIQSRRQCHMVVGI